MRCNARTIGNAVSGANERANADTQTLFEYLWNNDTDLRATVSASSGNATTDYNAGKTIQLPDYRGCVVIGLDDMGNSPSGRIDSTSFGATTTVLGKLGGDDYGTLTQPMLPNSTLTFTGTASSVVTSITLGAAYQGGASGLAASSFATGAPAGSVSSINGGVKQSGHSRVQPARTATIYIKL